MFEFEQMNEELKPYCSGENIFDYYRLVNPKTHEVFKYGSNGILEIQEEKCFEFWDRKDHCPNCVSRHSCVKQRQYVKLEFIYGKVFIILSKPVKIQENMLSFELVKDITNSMLGYNYYRAESKNVENIVSQFNELAVRDILTGLYNMDYINNYLEDFLRKEVAFNTLVAGAVDIDSYTKINAMYGYIAGNEVLQYVAGIMEKCALSYGGMAGRLGPDEIGIFFINKTKEEVEAICDELHKEASKKPLKIQGEDFEIKFTSAVAEIRNDDEPDDFIGRLYFNLRMAQGKK